MPCACARWHESWNATVAGSGCRDAAAVLREQLADVAHLLGEALGPVVAEQPPVLLQVRSAAGRVDDDQLDALEDVDEPPRAALPSSRRPACTESAPQQPCGRSDDLAAVRGEHASGCRVDVAEDDALDAAGEEPDPRRALHLPPASARAASPSPRHGGATSTRGRSASAAAARGRAAQARARRRIRAG